MAVTGAAPLLGMYLRMFGSRELLARFLAVNDDTAIDNWNPESGLDKLVCDDREALLVSALGEIHEQPQHEPINVAVVYGADHALPVVRYLMASFGYVVRKPEWVTVFEY